MVTVTKRSFEPLERIKFGVVLLPNDAVLTKLKCVSETICSIVQKTSFSEHTGQLFTFFNEQEISL